MTEIKHSGALRRTKIIATLGPATDDEAAITALLEAGVDAVRVNFSHGDAEQHLHRTQIVRDVSKRMHYYVGVIGDLQGPKIRIERFADGEVHLEQGQTFVLDRNLGRNDGNRERVGLTYPDLYKDVRVNDELMLDDGRVMLKVVSSDGHGIVTTVEQGDVLSGNKGVNRRGGGLSAPSISAKDHEDVKLAAEMGVDYLAVSFPRHAGDMNKAKGLLRDAGSNAGIIAKIERAEALEAIDEIMQVSDGIMIARGDLSLEIGHARLIAVQKRLIKQARTRDKVVITATEMMQSMIESPVPTRAEISDVANAVLDGTDAVMLSGETAVGKHPMRAVEAMGEICRGAEEGEHFDGQDPLLMDATGRVDRALAAAAIYTGGNLKVSAIAALTESGSTALWMSRANSSIPIYALTSHVETRRKVTLYRGVYPGSFDASHRSHRQANVAAIKTLKVCYAVKDGDLVIITKGDLMGVHGGTNAMKVVRVGFLQESEETE